MTVLANPFTYEIKNRIVERECLYSIRGFDRPKLIRIYQKKAADSQRWEPPVITISAYGPIENSDDCTAAELVANYAEAVNHAVQQVTTWLQESQTG